MRYVEILSVVDRAVFEGSPYGEAMKPMMPTVVPLPGAHVHCASGPADRITTLLLSEGTPPTADINGLALRPR
ncbi:hypothetical protein [Streptomyces koelreuteriae]|uniref:hypothetical protein n=1 Tax=Streptomyces koelreuteriae TaxID=2838015 RepID=UPI003EBB41CA